ncbi:hypothetical protein [Amycolatopsis aidingensis]|uniref:hypothetical protein n=1 Tax=Amycolatopsis aidingensis TaxID=2842453 RepID=UPI001C0AA76D|nr:hypothetical protein [Amycolatopsis aidingensis]
MTQTAISSPTRNAITAMYVGLALTLIAAVVPIIDQDSLSKPVVGKYQEYTEAELEGARSFVMAYLITLAAIGVVCWLLMIWAARRQKGWTRVTATTIFVLALGIALMNLVLEEYGNKIVPTSMAVAGLLPCVAGLVAVVFLWKREKVPAAA